MTAQPIRCADCAQPATVRGRCTHCHLAHELVEYAADYGIQTTTVRAPAGPRVAAEGADGRRAWLDTLIDVRYLAAELTCPPTPPELTRERRASTNKPPHGGWAHAHAACTECGTTARPHLGRGYCTACYWRVKRAGGFTTTAATTVPISERTAA